jgi:hypothetical protein
MLAVSGRDGSTKMLPRTDRGASRNLTGHFRLCAGVGRMSQRVNEKEMYPVIRVTPLRDVI